MEIRIGADKIIEVLEGIRKKTKLDRYEEMVMTELMIILQESLEPEVEIVSHPMSGKETPGVLTTTDVGVVDKVAIVKRIMDKTNPKGLDMIGWIKESIAIAQKPPLSIKDVPKSNDMVAFYEWLLINGIIEPNGNPKGK